MDGWVPKQLGILRHEMPFWINRAVPFSISLMPSQLSRDSCLQLHYNCRSPGLVGGSDCTVPAETDSRDRCLRNDLAWSSPLAHKAHGLPAIAAAVSGQPGRCRCVDPLSLPWTIFKGCFDNHADNISVQHFNYTLMSVRKSDMFSN